MGFDEHHAFFWKSLARIKDEEELNLPQPQWAWRLWKRGRGGEWTESLLQWRSVNILPRLVGVWNQIYPSVNPKLVGLSTYSLLLSSMIGEGQPKRECGPYDSKVKDVMAGYSNQLFPAVGLWKEYWYQILVTSRLSENLFYLGISFFRRLEFLQSIAGKSI